MKRYDIGLIFNSSPDEKFVGWVRRECALRRFKFILINEKNAREVLDKINKAKLQISFLLDNEADYARADDVFAKICYGVKDHKGYVLCDPDDAKAAANKAIAHYDLEAAGVPVPYTVVIRNWQPDTYKISRREQKALGKPFIIKPATGFGQKGVVREADASLKTIATARDFNRGDDFLLQEKIVPAVFDNREAWFRVYYLFGEIIPCWWDTKTGRYIHVSLHEVYKFKLLPLARITSRIAKLTNMEFFASEIAARKKKNRYEFLAIDYVNDQPELCVRAHLGREGPVPDIVEHIAEKVVDIAFRKSKSVFKAIHRSIWLKEAHLEDESI